MLVGPGSMGPLEEYSRPVPYRPKIPTHLQVEILRLDGTICCLPDDWQTRRLILQVITKTAEDVDGVAELMKEKGFIDVRTHTGGDPSIYPPGSVSGYLPYDRLLVLDEVANLNGVSHIKEIHPARPALM